MTFRTLPGHEINHLEGGTILIVLLSIVTLLLMRGRRLNQALSGQILKRVAAERSLQELKQDLENQIADRVSDLQQVIETRRQVQANLAHRNHILELLARGRPLAEILSELVSTAEMGHGRMRCAILLLDEKGDQLHIGAESSLPAFMSQAIEGMKIGPHAGPCGMAAYSGERIVVADLQSHPSCEPFRDLAARAGVRSCCSEPIFSSTGTVLGTFACYYPESETLSAVDDENLSAIANLAGIAIERSRVEHALLVDASVFENSHDGIIITDAQNRIVDVNRAFTAVTGYELEEVRGKDPKLLQSGRQEKAFYQDLWQTLKDSGHWQGEIWNRKKSGEFYAALLDISVVKEAHGEVSHHVGVFTDITKIKDSERNLEILAHYDPLTRLPNRALLADRLQQAIALAERHHQLLAVAFLDLDGFKPINDRFGHAMGDKLLIGVAQRLQTALRAMDTVARLGGDEFVLLVTDLFDMDHLDPLLTRIRDEVSAPFEIDGQVLQVSASIGVTVYPLDAADGDTLLRHADQAMYQAKQSGRNRYLLFDPSHDQQLQDRHQQLDRLKKAIESEELVLLYQPTVNLRSGEVVGLEALVRWRDPDHGLLAPKDFLPVLEQTDLIVTMGDWVLNRALDQMTLWAEQGLHLPVSINIAARQLQRADFVERLQAALASHPMIPPHGLELEILESAALEDIRQAGEVIRACRQLGVGFALDDFGTGYCSLLYLKNLPADTLKIDQSFVRDMLDDPEDLAIVEGVLSLATAFHRSVVAEGVETPEHGLMLMRLGCDVVQGYAISAPMPPEAVIDWVAQFHSPTFAGGASAPYRETLDNALLLAEADHLQWVGRVIMALDGASLQISREEIRDHHQCRFGRWYDREGLADMGALPEFQAIAPIHEALHQVGFDIIRLRDSGAIEQARQRVPELMQLKDQILTQLIALGRVGGQALPT